MKSLIPALTVGWKSLVLFDSIWEFSSRNRLRGNHKLFNMRKNDSYMIIFKIQVIHEIEKYPKIRNPFFTFQDRSCEHEYGAKATRLYKENIK